MAVKLADLQQEVKKAEYRVGDQVIEVEFLPGVWTSEFMDELASQETDSRKTADLLARSLSSLGITDEQDRPIKIDGETLYREVPFVVLTGILDAIQEVQFASKKSKTPSRGSFSTGSDPEED